MQVPSVAPTSGLDAFAGGNLPFGLDEETNGLDIQRGHKIMGLRPITPLPNTPRFVRGVTKSHGEAIPTIALRGKFGLPDVDDTERNCIIVPQVAGSDSPWGMGILVDAVSKLAQISRGQLEPVPALGAVAIAFVCALGKMNNKVVILLKADRVLTESEWATVAQGATA